MDRTKEKPYQKKQRKLHGEFMYCCVLCFRAHSRCEAKCDKTKLFAFVVFWIAKKSGEKESYKRSKRASLEIASRGKNSKS